MTVVKVAANLVGDTVLTCQWFYGEMQKETFIPDALVPSQPRNFEELKGAGSFSAPLTLAPDASEARAEAGLSPPRAGRVR